MLVYAGLFLSEDAGVQKIFTDKADVRLLAAGAAVRLRGLVGRSGRRVRPGGP